MIIKVDPADLENPAIVAHYASKPKAYHTGMRFALETLGIALPSQLQRKPSGRPRAIAGNPSRMTAWRDRNRALENSAHSPA
jgi:hypothetical protein